MAGRLNGCRVVTTRAERGRLDDELSRLGASVVHLPLIASVDVAAAEPVEDIDWVVVTSPNGARRALPWVRHPATKLAAVGATTAAVLADVAGRPVDVVPARASATDLVAALPSAPAPGHQMVVLRGDLAEDTVVDAARSRGWDVTGVTVYRTEMLEPAAADVRAAAEADVVLLASGSAARSWVGAVERAGVVSPPVIAIGPPTAIVARDARLVVAAVADPPGVDGLIAATLAEFGT